MTKKSPDQRPGDLIRVLLNKNGTIINITQCRFSVSGHARKHSEPTLNTFRILPDHPMNRRLPLVALRWLPAQAAR